MSENKVSKCRKGKKLTKGLAKHSLCLASAASLTIWVHLPETNITERAGKENSVGESTDRSSEDPDSTWRLTTVCTIVPGDLILSSGLLRRGTHTVGKILIYIKIKIILKNSNSLETELCREYLHSTGSQILRPSTSSRNKCFYSSLTFTFTFLHLRRDGSRVTNELWLLL